MFGDNRLTERAVILKDPHVEYMNETDGRAGVDIDVHALRAPRLIGLVTFGTGLKLLDLEEVECPRDSRPAMARMARRSRFQR